MLFHMATGSGKTLVMAASILHLYHLGYRDFIFFVNSKSILEKTRYNFLRSSSLKYLYDREIIIDGQQVKIKEISNLDQSNKEHINLKFTTIQKLHQDLHSPSENQINIEDFSHKMIVLISDEAHHINVSTKALNPDKPSWENTIEAIRNKSADNVLLEYTATMPLDHPSVSAKYENKVVYNYPLGRFRDSGYSKLVETHYLHQSDIDRVLVAITVSQIRKIRFAKYGISVKPVVLLKSASIKASAENRISTENAINSLDSHRMREILSLEVIQQYWDESIDTDEFIKSLKINFSKEQSITIDSKNDSETHQILINELENENNPIRLIYAVDKLNEGWDVLNLFDIVRLGGSNQSKVTKKSTTAEAQLIGRGARYYPFQVSSDQDKYRRKYDSSNHELNLCETLFYYANYVPDYIAKMEQVLLDLDIKSSNQVNYKPVSRSTTILDLHGITIGNGPYEILPNDIPRQIFIKALMSHPTFRYDKICDKVKNMESLLDLRDKYSYTIHSPKDKSNLLAEDWLQLSKATLSEIANILPR